MKILNLRFLYGKAVRDILLVYYFEFLDFSHYAMCIIHNLAMLLPLYDRNEAVLDDEAEADLLFAEMLLEAEDHLYHNIVTSTGCTNTKIIWKNETTYSDNDSCY